MTYTPRRHRYGLRARPPRSPPGTLTPAACGSSGSGVSSTRPGRQRAGRESGLRRARVDQRQRRDIAQYTKMVTSYAAQQTVPGVSALKGKSVWYIPIGESVPILAAFGTAHAGRPRQVGITTHICDGKFLPTNAAACIPRPSDQGAERRRHRLHRLRLDADLVQQPGVAPHPGAGRRARPRTAARPPRPSSPSSTRSRRST